MQPRFRSDGLSSSPWLEFDQSLGYLCLRSQHRASFFLANQMNSDFRLRTQRSKQSQGKSLDTKLNKHTLELLVADDGDDPGRRAVIRVGHELVGLEL